MNVFNFFLISEFTQILDSFGKSNLSSKYRFNGIEDLSFVIDTKLNKNNDLVFTFNFYKKNKKLDFTDMSTLHIVNLLNKFRLYVENLAPFKQDLQIPKIPKIPKKNVEDNSQSFPELGKTEKKQQPKPNPKQKQGWNFTYVKKD